MENLHEQNLTAHKETRTEEHESDEKNKNKIKGELRISEAPGVSSLQKHAPSIKPTKESGEPRKYRLDRENKTKEGRKKGEKKGNRMFG